MNRTTTRNSRLYHRRSALLAVVAAFAFAFAGPSALAQPVAPTVDPAAGQAQAGQQPDAVIELFTSQGCSSCPPADKLLRELADNEKYIALTLPVDYWDYLGWTDTFASERNTERQRNYAKTRGDGAIYTPQAVINGTLHVNGARRNEITNAIKTTEKEFAERRVPIRFWNERNTLNIAIGQSQSGEENETANATVWLGIVQNRGTVDVERGENAGEQLTYTNIVREMAPIGLWQGNPMHIRIPRGAVMMAQAQKIVVLIQENGSGPIIGAAIGNLW